MPYFSSRGRPSLKCKTRFQPTILVNDNKKKKIELLVEKFKRDILKILSEK